MPTSDKRREVAERLRENATKHGVVLDYLGSTQVASWWLLLHTIGCNSNEQEVAFNMLADLIDPTCRIVSGDADNHMPHCNLCGTDNFDLLPKYCKGCGARIVYNENVN